MTKDKILSILIKDGGYVSGEAMSHALGMSRAAVNSAIKALRGEGYEIYSVTNRGYMLISAPDRLTAGALMPLLPEGRCQNVICLDTVTSTNDYLRTLAFDGAPDGQVVIADGQSAGRGRMGRKFESPEKKGIYFSMLLRPDTLPADTAQLTAWTAVAVSRAIKNTCGVMPGIKWINDLVINKLKVCGILTEMSVESESGRVQFVILGVGINANESPEDFPPEIRGVASSIYAQTGRRVDRSALAAELIKEMDALRRAWPEGRAAYFEEYGKACVTVGREVCLVTPGREEKAFAESIDAFFGLVVRMPDGSRRTISSGEVSVRGMYGYA